MKVYFTHQALDRINMHFPSILETFSSIEGLRPNSIDLRDLKTGRRIPESEVIPFAQANSWGCINAESKWGICTLRWSHHPKAWFDSISGDLCVPSNDLESLVPVVRHTAELVCSAYSFIEMDSVFEATGDFSYEPLGDPWDRLDDLFWYNYFGPDLTKVLREDHGLLFDLPALSQQQLGRGWEVRIDGPPRPRPRAPELVQYLTRSGIFRFYSPQAQFKNGRIQFDYSKLREQDSRTTISSPVPDAGGQLHVLVVPPAGADAPVARSMLKRIWSRLRRGGDGGIDHRTPGGI